MDGHAESSGCCCAYYRCYDTCQKLNDCSSELSKEYGFLFGCTLLSVSSLHHAVVDPPHALLADFNSTDSAFLACQGVPDYRRVYNVLVTASPALFAIIVRDEAQPGVMAMNAVVHIFRNRQPCLIARHSWWCRWVGLRVIFVACRDVEDVLTASSPLCTSDWEAGRRRGEYGHSLPYLAV